MSKSVFILTVFLVFISKLFAQQTNEGANSSRAFDSIAAKTGVLRIVDKKMGFQSVLGKWFVEPKYDWIETSKISSDYVPVIRHGFVKVMRNGQYGIVDLKGNTIIPCTYLDISPAGNGFMTQSESGEVVRFDFSGNKLPVKKQSDFTEEGVYHTYNVENMNGDSILHLVNVPYRVMFESASEGFTMVLFYPYDPNSADGGIGKGVYGFLNRNGKWAIEPRLPISQDFYAHDRSIYHFHSGRALVRKGKEAWYIDTTGRTVFSVDTLLKASDIYPFTDFGYAPVVYWEKNQVYVIYYNTDGSVRLRTTDNLVLGMNTAWSPLTDYLHYLPLLDKQTNEYILLDEQLKNELSRFSIVDSLSIWPRNADGLVMTKDFLFLRRQTKDTRSNITIKIISPDGKLVHDWFGLDQAYDPYTGIYILHEDHGIRLMDRSTGKVVFQCDSCNCDYDSDYRYGFPPGASGLYNFYNLPKSNSQKSQVNYYGQVFNDPVYQSGKNSSDPYYFGHDLSPALRTKIMFNYKQAYFDQLYRKLDWERYRKLLPK